MGICSLLKAFYLISSITFINLSPPDNSAHNLGYCADSHCSGPLASGFALVNYSPDGSNKLHLKQNDVVFIYVRDYGEKKDLLGVEVQVNGVRGYVPKMSIKEVRNMSKNKIPAVVDFVSLKKSDNGRKTDRTSFPVSRRLQYPAQSIRGSQFKVPPQSTRGSQIQVPPRSTQGTQIQAPPQSPPAIEKPPSAGLPSQTSHNYKQNLHTPSSPIVIPQKESSQTTDHALPSNQTQQATQRTPNMSYGFKTPSGGDPYPTSSTTKVPEIPLPPSTAKNHQNPQDFAPPSPTDNREVSSTEAVVSPVPSYEESSTTSIANTLQSSMNDMVNTKIRNAMKSLESHYLSRDNDSNEDNDDSAGIDGTALSLKQLANSEGRKSTLPHQQQSAVPQGFDPSKTSDHLSSVNEQEDRSAKPESNMLNDGKDGKNETGNSLPDGSENVPESESEAEESKNETENSLPDGSENVPESESEAEEESKNEIPLEDDSKPKLDSEGDSNERNLRPVAGDNIAGNDATASNISVGAAEANNKSYDRSDHSTDEEHLVDNRNDTSFEGIGISANVSDHDSEGKTSNHSGGVDMLDSEAINNNNVDEVKKEDVEDKNSIKSEDVDDNNSIKSADVEDNNRIKSADVEENNSIKSEHVEDNNRMKSEGIEDNNSIKSEDVDKVHQKSEDVNKTGDVKQKSEDVNKNVDVEHESGNANAMNNTDQVSLNGKERVDGDNFSNLEVPNRQLLEDTSEDVPVTEPKALESSSLLPDVEKDVPVSEMAEQPTNVNNESSSFTMENLYKISKNALECLRASIDVIASHLPTPVQLYLKSLNVTGISSRAVIFLVIISFPCAVILVGVIYIKERFKEQKIISELSKTEHELYLASSERDILRDDFQTLKNESFIIKEDIEKEIDINSALKQQILDTETLNETLTAEKNACLDEINKLSLKIADYEENVKCLQGAVKESNKEKEKLLKKIEEDKNSISKLCDTNDELNMEIKELELKEEKLIVSEKESSNNVLQLEQTCNQLLQEVKIWDTRVNELTDQLCSLSNIKEELDKTVETKDLEIEALKTAIENLEVLKCGDDSDREKKIDALVNVSLMQNKLSKTETEKELLKDDLKDEKNKVLEMEVELLSSKSEADKLKINYNLALQDRAEAQTKLNVLSNYFKDKEMQLQKELGVQEAVRQQKEEHATHTERKIHLIEEENASYKYQVATLKQEIEETEHNLKNMIAAQEKKAHENWLAARAAERKYEDLKQESIQIRQRLTLLEREQDNSSNSSQPSLIKPVPQRALNSSHNTSLSQENQDTGDFVLRHIPPPPIPLDYLHRPLPMRYPLAPGPSPRPPHFPPPTPFMRPHFDPMIPPPFRPPWHSDRSMDSDRRNTPSDYDALTGRHPMYYDRERDNRSMSPIEPISRSRESTPPHPLPAFHNVPPPLQRHHEFVPMIPGPLPHGRLRDLGRPIPQSSTNTRNGNNNIHHQHQDADV